MKNRPFWRCERGENQLPAPYIYKYICNFHPLQIYSICAKVFAFCGCRCPVNRTRLCNAFRVCIHSQCRAVFSSSSVTLRLSDVLRFSLRCALRLSVLCDLPLLFRVYTYSLLLPRGKRVRLPWSAFAAFVLSLAGALRYGVRYLSKGTCAMVCALRPLFRRGVPAAPCGLALISERRCKITAIPDSTFLMHTKK